MPPSPAWCSTSCLTPPRPPAKCAAWSVPGGTAAAYVWDYAGEMQLMRRFWAAAVALDPAAGALDESIRFSLCKPDALRALWTSAGLQDIEVRTIDVPTVFKDFDDYWSPFLGGQGPAPTYCMSLPEDHRERLRQHLHDTLPIEGDGSIRLIARAFAVRGRKPHEAAAGEVSRSG